MTPREQELLQTVNELRTENALLRQKIDLLVKRVFGSSSEPLDKNQLELLAQPEANATVQAIGRNSFPSTLCRVKIGT